MLAVRVTVRVEPALRDECLKTIETHAPGSEKDEPGCIRCNGLQNTGDENVYRFYDVYESDEARAAHRAASRYAVWTAAAQTLEGPPERAECTRVLPADRSYWRK
ncbi:MAG: hypothetical protein GKR94_30705 [Gammaproteobacteria bacterium]|nr:hypothetical protein [Gammaproteobacteria bacterium]